MLLSNSLQLHLEHRRHPREDKCRGCQWHRFHLDFPCHQYRWYSNNKEVSLLCNSMVPRSSNSLKCLSSSHNNNSMRSNRAMVNRHNNMDSNLLPSHNSSASSSLSSLDSSSTKHRQQITSISRAMQLRMRTETSLKIRCLSPASTPKQLQLSMKSRTGLVVSELSKWIRRHVRHESRFGLKRAAPVLHTRTRVQQVLLYLGSVARTLLVPL